MYMTLKNTRVMQSILIWYKTIIEISNNYYSISIKARLGIIQIINISLLCEVCSQCKTICCDVTLKIIDLIFYSLRTLVYSNANFRTEQSIHFTRLYYQIRNRQTESHCYGKDHQRHQRSKFNKKRKKYSLIFLFFM